MYCRALAGLLTSSKTLKKGRKGSTIRCKCDLIAFPIDEIAKIKENTSIANLNILNNLSSFVLATKHNTKPHSDWGRKLYLLHSMSLLNSSVETLTHFSVLEVNQ